MSIRNCRFDHEAVGKNFCQRLWLADVAALAFSLLGKLDIVD
jgi:hypothetical protein